MLIIDGSQGEGGGQILRTSLALSMCLTRPFKITNIRATRKNPGLRPQHLMAVNAAARVSQAIVEGAETGSQQLLFQPHGIRAGQYDFDIGTAGSTTLVLQTVLPALMLAEAPSTILLQGGTHNPLAPPYNFIEQTFIPLINLMGPKIMMALKRPGFYPRGGGIIKVNIQPAQKLHALHLAERGPIRQLQAEILLCHLPEYIAKRESRLLKEELELVDDEIRIIQENTAISPGNAVSISVESTQLTEVFSAIGERGLPAKEVATRVIREVKHYLNANVAVAAHLADQLLLPIALAGEGSFLTCRPSLHTRTNMAVIQQFMNIEFSKQELRPDAWLIELHQ